MGRLLRFLVPRDERDPLFRAEIERLSVQGLRIIAVVGFAANLLSYLLFLLWMPSIPVWMPAADAVAFGLLFVFIGLTWWRPFRPHARWVCLVILFLSFAGQMLTAGEQFEIPLDPKMAGPVIVSMCVLLAVTALPVKPLQVLALTAVSFFTSYGATRYRELDFSEAKPISILVILLFMATVLTAVLYRQRADGFQARLTAEEALDASQEGQARLLVSENARSQNRFAAALCHELNTPLGALSSSLDMLVLAQTKLGPDVEEKVRRTVSDAGVTGKQSLRRLEETIERMKHLVNLDRAEVQVVDLNELWRDTVGLLDDALAPRVTFTRELEPLPPVPCRPQQLAAVFTNFVRNAAAAIEEKGTIRIRTARRDSEAVIEVIDDVKGIPESQLPHHFEPAFRTDGGRVTTSNWGLFVSRGIVTGHGGHIEVEGEEGKGTTARIRLPLSEGGPPGGNSG